MKLENALSTRKINIVNMKFGEGSLILRPIEVQKIDFYNVKKWREF